MTTRDQYVGRCVALSQAAAVFVITTGFVVLVGWGCDIAVLKSVHSGMVTMKANTALALVLCGLSLLIMVRGGGKRLMLRRPYSRLRTAASFLATVCALLVTVLGSLTLCEYVFCLDWGFDQWLVKESADAVLTLHPGRMAASTAVEFVLLGVALLLLDRRAPSGRGVASYLAVAAGLIALMSMTGYIYGASAFYFGVGRYTAMALHTACALVILSLGILLARPDSGPVGVLVSDGLGGRVARRLMPLTIFLPPLLGWLTLQGGAAGFYGPIFGTMLFALGSVLVLACIVWQTVASLVRQETERQAIETQYRTLFESSSDAVMTTDASHFLDCNTATLRMFGYDTKEQFTALHPGTVSPPHQPSGSLSRTAADQRIAEAFAHGTSQFEWTHRRHNGEEFPAEVRLTAFQLGDRRIVQATVRDISDRVRAEQALLDRQQQLCSLMAELTVAEEKERRRIAHGLHDDLCQMLVASKLQLAALPKIASREASREVVTRVEQYLDQILVTARTLTFDLVSPILHSFGLVAAVENLCERMEEQYGVSCGEEHDRQPLQLKGDVEILLFHVVRELLQNAFRHAKATRVRVLFRHRDDGHLLIGVEDDGVGFNGRAEKGFGPAGGFGLWSIRERMAYLGGELAVEAVSTHGTRITLTVPPAGQEVKA
jgi:PAS domain S-box-containing protein